MNNCSKGGQGLLSPGTFFIYKKNNNCSETLNILKFGPKIVLWGDFP